MSRKYSKHKNKKQGHSGHSAHSSHGETLKGKLDVTRSGMGFVIVENNPEDILVRPNDFNTAMHGDIVTVRVRGDQSRTGRKQGEITEVVKRKQVEFMGRIEISKNFAFFIVNSDKPMPDIYVPINKLNGAQHGDQAIVKIIEWEKNKKPMGEVLQVMDSSDVNDQAMKEILIENGFPLMFPESVIEESERIPDVLSSEEISRRRDFREVLTFTIDPVDAKDFDDAISFQVLKNGNYEIGVHIADVSYYVEPGTDLDKEAYDRATSVYLPDRVSPMLPERISNELCSLRPNEDKFTFASVFEITPQGAIKSQWLGRTVIHSNHRFTYEDAQEIIETKEGEYKKEILLLNDLAQNYRRERFRKGAINFSSQEVRFKLDETGKPIGIVVKESKEAHQLIEEFMLLANRAVAEAVGKVKVNNEEIPFPYRVHDTPDEVKLTPFITFAKKYGHTFDTSSPENISRSFNQMLADVKGKPEQHVLEQLGIRTMAKAIYTTENIGHYGLGFEHYCHFTSPIRRYPDVMVHRILQEVLDRKVEPDKKLEQKCKHCSDKERSAMEAERAANKYKQVEYMQDFLGEEFEGVISGVSSFGFWVETVQHKCEGLVSISNLQDYDDFRLIEGEYCLVGLRSGRKFRMGDKLNIRVVAANLTKRQLDYEWVLPQGSAATGSEAGQSADVASIVAGEFSNSKEEINWSKTGRDSANRGGHNRPPQGGSHFDKKRGGKYGKNKDGKPGQGSGGQRFDSPGQQRPEFNKRGNDQRPQDQRQQGQQPQDQRPKEERPQDQRPQKDLVKPVREQKPADRPVEENVNVQKSASEQAYAGKVKADRPKIEKPAQAEPAPATPANKATPVSKEPVSKPADVKSSSKGSGEPAPAKSAASKSAVSKTSVTQTPALKASASKVPAQSAPAAKAQVTKPASAGPLAVKSPGAKSATSNSAPAKSTPTKSSPTKSTPVKAAPAKSTPTKSSPAKLALVKAAPAKSAPSKSAPARSAPPKTTPPKTTPAKTTPAKATPAKSASSATSRPAPARSASPAGRSVGGSKKAAGSKGKFTGPKKQAGKKAKAKNSDKPAKPKPKTKTTTPKSKGPKL